MSTWIREAQYVEDKFLEQLEALGWVTSVVVDHDNKNRTDKAHFLKTTWLLHTFYLNVK